MRSQAHGGEIHAVKGERGDPHRDAGDDEAVGNGVGLQVHERQAQKDAAERAQGERVDGQSVDGHHAHEEEAAEELGRHIARRDALAAVTAATPEEEPAEHGHQVERCKGVVAHGAVAAALPHALAVHEPPRQAVDETAQARAQQPSYQQEEDRPHGRENCEVG